MEHFKKNAIGDISEDFCRDVLKKIKEKFA